MFYYVLEKGKTALSCEFGEGNVCKYCCDTDKMGKYKSIVHYLILLCVFLLKN